mmetsp:Transcript_57337/g.64101  ORF Transcript_57337/g.64101 Transcript_57337/m.64101 type:complete len:677 (-) Transcript_57337:98-2128(-)
MISSFLRRTTNIGITTKITITATALLTSLYAGRTYSCQAFSSSISSSSLSSSLFSLLPHQQQQQQQYRSLTSLRMSPTKTITTIATGTTTIPTWDELQSRISTTSVGKALNDDLKLRLVGKGSPNVHSTLRLFDSSDTSESDNPDETKYTIYRDHAGWCPYCQKTMLLIEAKEIPITIELINMRSYGDKSSSFLRKVPNGLLPALENNESGKVTLDSAYIMEFLENEYNKNWNGENKNGKKKVMVPDSRTQPEQYKKYTKLMTLERELFSWWCTFMFRQEQPNPSSSSGNGIGGLMGNIFGNNKSSTSTNNDGDNDDDADANYVSPTMNGFLNCLETVDLALSTTKGPYFLDYTTSHPTMIDFVFASHIERMLASCAYWKGMNLRSPQDYPTLKNLRTWMDSLETHDYYLAFKSDYYTHVKDIPPQYGPSSKGVSRLTHIQEYQNSIEGTSKSNSNSSWKLPLDDDDSLQPLYNGIPLPKPVLQSMNIQSDNNDGSDSGRGSGSGSGSGSYKKSASTRDMKVACQLMAVWKLTNNGANISKFAARGGPDGSKNVRKTFGAELADPYAKSDATFIDTVDEVLRIVATSMIIENNNENENENESNTEQHHPEPNSIPGSEYASLVQNSVTTNKKEGVIASLEYLRDRIGVPRDLPLASARYLRAYLNWAIDVLKLQQQ